MEKGCGFEISAAGNVYCLSDIHNDYDSFIKMLDKIRFSDSDILYVLGDYFDRNEKKPEPIRIYRHISSAGNIVGLIGNHDRWLANDIKAYLRGFEKRSYMYNTFGILRENMSNTELKELADWIDSLPRYVVVECGGRKFMMAHALTVPDPEETSTLNNN